MPVGSIRRGLFNGSNTPHPRREIVMIETVIVTGTIETKTGVNKVIIVRTTIATTAVTVTTI